MEKLIQRYILSFNELAEDLLQLKIALILEEEEDFDDIINGVQQRYLEN